MRSSRSLLTIVIAAVVLMLGLVSAPAGATADADSLSVTTVPPLDPNAEPAEAPENLLGDGEVEGVFDEAGNLEGYFDDDGNFVPLDYAAPLEGLAASCRFAAYADYVHTSAGDASGHGYWETSYACRNGYADVTVRLFEYYSDGSWRQKASRGPVTLRPYNYYKQRANARRDCDNTLSTSWRSRAGASSRFAIDGWYVADWTYSPSRSISCRVY